MKALCSRVAIASATALVVGYWPTHGWTQTPTDNKVPAIVGAWASGRTVEGALKEANTRGFRANPLGVRLKAAIPTRVDPFVSNNVAGMVEKNISPEKTSFRSR